MAPEQFSGNILLWNGDIRVSPPWNRSVEALAVEDGYISAVGEAALDARSRFQDHNIIDLNGRTALPGFTDSHLHLSMLGERLTQLDIPGESDKSGIQKHVAEAVKVHQKDEWIVGGKWSRHALGGFPDKSMLDQVAPANPVALYSKDLHSVLLNSEALRLANIDRYTSEPSNGKIIRDDTGEPTGVLLEDAMELFERSRPEKSGEAFRREHREAALHCFAHGITSVHSIEHWKDFTTYQDMRKRGQLQIRVGCLIYKEYIEEVFESGIQSGDGDDWLWLIGIKAFTDGALGSRTAWMKQPYENTSDWGIPVMRDEELHHLLQRTRPHNLGLGVHAIGDAAVSLCLDALSGENRLHHRIEHLQLIDPNDLHKVTSAFSAAVQPVHLLGDRNPADRWWGERARYAYAFRTLLDRGVNLAFGSDAPVEEVNPWLSIQAAVERRLADDEQQWYPEERLNLNEAITAFTVGSAAAGHRERTMGSLTVGSPGDIIILNENPWSVRPTELHNIQPDMTIVNGVRVYNNG